MAQVKTEHRKGEPSKTTCREICRYYINGKGQCEVIGLKRTMGPYLDCVSYYEGMALRYDNDTYSHLATFPLYPKMDVIPELERRSALGTLCSSKNGFTGDLYGLAPLTMFKAILRDRSISCSLGLSKNRSVRRTCGSRNTTNTL